MSSSPAAAADRPNAVWPWDFIFDRTDGGGTLKILSLIDEYSRCCVRLRVEATMTASAVVATLEDAIERHGAPGALRSDNGPEFVAKEIQQWLRASSIGTIYIDPDSPWVESFHSRLRDGCLDREIFHGLLEAQIVIGDWREHHNHERPTVDRLQVARADLPSPRLRLQSACGLPAPESCNPNHTRTESRLTTAGLTLQVLLKQGSSHLDILHSQHVN